MDSIPAYLLTTGSSIIDDYDMNLGIFTDVESLKKAYLGLAAKKQKEIQEQGYSLIHTLKIYKFSHVNFLLEDYCEDIKVDPLTLGLPKIIG